MRLRGENFLLREPARWPHEDEGARRNLPGKKCPLRLLRRHQVDNVKHWLAFEKASSCVRLSRSGLPMVFDELFQFDFLRYQYFLVLSLLLLVSYLLKPKKILCRAVGNRFPKSRTFLINYRTVTGYWQLPNDNLCLVWTWTWYFIWWRAQQGQQHPTAQSRHLEPDILSFFLRTVRWCPASIPSG